MIGVLGGMGPLATVDFFRKVVEEAQAGGDEDHVPLLIQSDPRIPRRPEAILAGGASPLPALLAGRDRLVRGGALALAMPCNTAHYWYGALVQDCPVPFLSMVDAACDDLAVNNVPRGAVGILATRATIAADVYSRALGERGYELLTPPETDLEQCVLPAIAAVKAGREQSAGEFLLPVLGGLEARGAGGVIVACSELPLALDPLVACGRLAESSCLDATRSLARACVRFWAGCETVP